MIVHVQSCMGQPISCLAMFSRDTHHQSRTNHIDRYVVHMSSTFEAPPRSAMLLFVIMVGSLIVCVHPCAPVNLNGMLDYTGFGDAWITFEHVENVHLYLLCCYTLLYFPVIYITVAQIIPDQMNIYDIKCSSLGNSNMRTVYEV